jgi:hypothetical protein
MRILGLVGALLLLGCGGSTSDDAGSSGGKGGVGTGGVGTGGVGTGGVGTGGVGTGGTGATGGIPTPGCQLNLAVSAELPAPVSPDALVTGPAIAATNSGFVISYRDQDPSTGYMRQVVQYISDAGVSGTTGSYELIWCANQKPSDGVGATFSGNGGLLVSSLPKCDDKGAGAVFLPFDDTGNVSNAAGPQNALASEITFATGGSVATGAAQGDYEVVYRTVTTIPGIQRAVLTGSDFKGGVPLVQPFGDGDHPYGMIASSSQVRALLAPVGSDTLLQLGPLNGDEIETSGVVTLPGGAAPWAALTAWQNRVAAATPASAGTMLVVAELGANGPQEIAGGVIGTTPVSSGALSTLRSHLLLAQGRNGGITLHRVEDASSGVIASPAASVEVTAAGVADFDGQHLALASTRKRVAVAWLTKHALASGDPTGGWALLECND